MNKWTLKEVVINKTRPVIILTIILMFALTQLINQLFTRKAVLENGFVHTTHFYLSVPAMLLLAIPVSIISVLLMQLFMNISGKQATPVEHRKEFKWYSLYSLIIGLLAFFALSKWVNTSVASVAVDTIGGGFLWTSAALFIPAAAAIVLAIILNRVMMRITNMNSRLILEIEQGIYEQNFKDFNTKNNVIKALRKGHTSTIPGAIWYVRSTAFLGRTFAVMMKAFGAFALIIWRQTPRINGTRSSGGSYRPVHNTGASQSDAEWQKRKAKSDAEYSARQKEKQADYSRRTLVNQLNYNPRHSQSEWNRYVNDQREAKEARDRAKRL